MEIKTLDDGYDTDNATAIWVVEMSECTPVPGDMKSYNYQPMGIDLFCYVNIDAAIQWVRSELAARGATDVREGYQGSMVRSLYGVIRTRKWADDPNDLVEREVRYRIFKCLVKA